MIHIAHLVFNFDVGGLENGIVNILNRLPGNTYRHSIICLKDYNPDFFGRITEADVKIYSLSKRPGKDLGYLLRLWRLLLQLKPDIVHSRNLTTLECQLTAWLAGIKNRIHGEHGWDSATAKTDAKPANIRRLFKPLISHYIALSREGERYLIDQARIRPAQITRICNGVDVELFQPAPDQQADPVLTIGTVGRLAEVKNQSLLIRAFAQLLDQRPMLKQKLKLLIIGDGPSRNKLLSMIDSLALNDHCSLAGNRHDIPQAMQELDIYVQPSKAEGISNTILEAMASGLPIITTDVGGARELVLDKQNGAVIDSDDDGQLVDALIYYIASPEIRIQHGRSSRSRAVELFSLEGMARQYDEVYRMFSPQLALQQQ